MIETMVIFLLIVTIGFLLLYRKLYTLRNSLLYEVGLMFDNSYNQLESLLGLYTELNLSHALPKTRGFAGSPDFLRNLMTHTLKNRPQTIVECSSGVSTLVLAHSLKKNNIKGHIYSLEHDPHYANLTRVLLEEHGVSDYATIIDAPLVKLTLNDWVGQWYTIDGLSEVDNIDLIVIDGPPQFTSENARYPAVPILFDKLSIGGVFVLDDSSRPDERWAVEKWKNDFAGRLTSLEMLRCEKGCDALVKQS